MSLELVALRLQTVAALGAHPVIAALCGTRLYDSRIDDFDHREPVPVIVVTTEAVEGEAFDPQNGGAPFDKLCRLVLEIGVRQLAPLLDEEGNDTGEEGIGYWSTDQQLEAQLNLLAWCAEQVLTTGRNHPSDPRMSPEGRLLLKAVTRRVGKRSIERFSSDETAERLAIHLVTFEVELKGEERDARNRPTGDFAGLPEPLRLVCEDAPDGSPALAVCRMLAGLITEPEARTLETIGIETTGLGLPAEDVAVPS